MFDRLGQGQGRWRRRRLSARVNGGAQNNVVGGSKPPLSSPWASKGNTIMIQEPLKLTCSNNKCVSHYHTPPYAAATYSTLAIIDPLLV
jgi:hypothetical protein